MLIVFILVEYVFAPIVVIGLMITFSFVLIRHSLVRKQNKILLLAQMQFNSELEKQIELRTEDLVEQKMNCIITNKCLNLYTSIIQIQSSH